MKMMYCISFVCFFFVVFFFFQKSLHLIFKKRNIALLLAFLIHGLAHRSL